MKFAEAELAFTNLQNAAYSALMPLMELLYLSLCKLLIG